MTKPTKSAAARKATPAKKSAPAKKSTPAKKSAPAKKSTPAKKSAPAKKSVVAKRTVVAVAPVVVQTPPEPKKRHPLSLVTRVRRTRGLPFPERLEAAMHRELNHTGPICHPCRMNASRLAALAGGPAVVAV